MVLMALDPHRYKDEIQKNKWLSDEPFGLPDFCWSVQPHDVLLHTVNWLQAWYKYRFLDAPRPKTLLFINGPNRLGKTRVLARGIARFHALNLCTWPVEFLSWGEYVDDQLNNGEKIIPNWQAKLLVLDDFDGQRPIPASLSTWLVDKLIARLKARSERMFLPTILTSNRNPGDMFKFLSTSKKGESDDDTKQSARTLLAMMGEHLFANITLKEVAKPAGMDVQTFYTHLRQRARDENDMAQLGFTFLEEYGEETLW